MIAFRRIKRLCIGVGLLKQIEHSGLAGGSFAMATVTWWYSFTDRFTQPCRYYEQFARRNRRQFSHSGNQRSPVETNRNNLFRRFFRLALLPEQTGRYVSETRIEPLAANAEIELETYSRWFLP